MAKWSGIFNRVAIMLADRFAELTGAAVLVIDENERIIAGDDRMLVGQQLATLGDGLRDNCMRLRLQLDGQYGEVLIARSLTGEVLSPKMAQTIMELVINQVLAVSGLPNQNVLKDRLIHDLLQGRAANESDIAREAHILGMSFSRPRAVILIDAGEYILAPTAPNGRESGEARQRRAQVIINAIVSFFCLPNETICAYIGEGEVAVLKASTPQDLRTWKDPAAATTVGPSWADLKALKRAASELLQRLREETGAGSTIGIGRYHPGVTGLAYSYQDARTALALGRRFSAPNHVYCLDDLGVAAFVSIADEQTKLDLARQLLSPLDGEPELLHTLEAYFATNCAPSLTANQLNVHRNTLTLRLNKINSLIGLDPHKFDDAVLIRLAMLLRAAANGHSA